MTRWSRPRRKRQLLDSDWVGREDGRQAGRGRSGWKRRRRQPGEEGTEAGPGVGLAGRAGLGGEGAIKVRRGFGLLKGLP